MKKGEIKKREIIRTAEYLFCRYGYEATSIQDILDALNTSKGSFYHHFTSKESLLEEICRNRAAMDAEPAETADPDQSSPVEALNRLYADMIPFSGEKLSFLLMILPVFNLPEGISLRSFYQKELISIYRTPVSAVLSEGTESGFFSCADNGFYAEISLRLVNSLWLEICDRIIRNEQEQSAADPMELMMLIGHYRTALERLLSAPFGSIELIKLPDLKALTEQIHQHWK